MTAESEGAMGMTGSRQEAGAEELLANQRAISETLERVTAAISGVEARAAAPQAALPVAPGANLAGYMRRSRISTAVIAIVATALLAAAIIPNRDNDDATTAAALSGPSGLGGTVEGDQEQPVAGADTPGDLAPAETGATAEAPGAATGSPSGAPGAAASSPSGGAPAAASGPTAPTASGNSSASGGATAPGVTATAVKVGVIDLDSSDLAAGCPRCGNGESAKGAATLALIKAWTRDGLLPVHGRTIEPTFRVAKVLASEQRRAACVDMAQTVKPFIVIPVWMGPDVTECLAREFKMLTLEAQLGGNEDLLGRSPSLFFVGPTDERIIRNYVHWAHEKGLFKGQKLGLYSDADPAVQATLNRSLRPKLKELGYSLEADVQSEGQQSAPIAVQRFRAAGVTTAILQAGFLEFQTAAQAQGYKPKYPIWDAAVALEDAVADITYVPEQMDGNLAFSTNWYDWAKRKPATPKNNDAAAYCFKEYQAYTGKQKDLFDNSAEIRYVTGSCAVMEVLRKALELAGPNLTRESFTSAMARVQKFPTTRIPLVSFGPTRRSAAELGTTFQFRASRWPETNLYFNVVEPFRPLWDNR